jgi:hypothetical protein
VAAAQGAERGEVPGEKEKDVPRRRGAKEKKRGKKDILQELIVSPPRI